MPGFTAITGETGAGKSIIISARSKLLLGERADKSLIRTARKPCTVDAVFAARDFADSTGDSKQAGVERGGRAAGEAQLFVRRSNRQFVNGSPVTLALLKMIGDELVDLHGPARSPVATFAASGSSLCSMASPMRRRNVAEYQECFRQPAGIWSPRKKHCARGVGARTGARSAAASGERNFCGRLQPNEEQEIVTRYKLASNSRRLIELATAISRQPRRKRRAVLISWRRTATPLRELEKIDPGLTETAAAHAAAVVRAGRGRAHPRSLCGAARSRSEQLAQLEHRVTSWKP
jgi:DNA repair protein RecN (Recombination protein N)